MRNGENVAPSDVQSVQRSGGDDMKMWKEGKEGKRDGAKWKAGGPFVEFFAESSTAARSITSADPEGFPLGKVAWPQRCSSLDELGAGFRRCRLGCLALL